MLVDHCYQNLTELANIFQVVSMVEAMRLLLTWKSELVNLVWVI